MIAALDMDVLLSDFYNGEPQSRTTIALVDDHLFDVLDPSTWSFRLDTIATSLSNLCRFNGHIRNFYSVAEHAVRVSDTLKRAGASARVQYLGLHHDDVESIIGDIPSPQKRIISLDGEPIKDSEANLEYALFGAMGILSDDFDSEWAMVKAADLAVYLEERAERPFLGVGLNPLDAKVAYIQLHRNLQDLMTRVGIPYNEF